MEPCIFLHTNISKLVGKSKGYSGREIFGCFFLWKKPVLSHISSGNKFPGQSHFDINFGGFSLVILTVWGGNHLISVQNKFSFCFSSSLSNSILSCTDASDVQETGRKLPIALITENAWWPYLRHHCNWPVWFISEQAFNRAHAF